MAKKKYYVVWEGLKTGVFDTWDECAKYTKGQSGAKYKSFKSKEEALKAFEGEYEDYKGTNTTKPQISKEEIEKIGLPNFDSVSVDAACSGNPGKVEYQMVETRTGEKIFEFGPLEESTNNIGEFLALVHALSHMKKVNDPRPIYSDSKIAIGWIKKKVYKTKLQRTVANEKSFLMLERAIKILKENDFRNPILKWETKAWGEIPADYGRK